LVGHTEPKALLEVGGQTLLARTLGAIRGAQAVDRILVAGPASVREEAVRSGTDEYTVAEGSAPQNIMDALRQVQGARTALIVTCDLPFLRPEHLTDFLAKVPSDAELALPLIEQAAFHRRFPGARSLFVPLRDGTFAAGCAYRVDVAAFHRSLPHIEDVFARRKSKVEMAKLLGIGFLLQLLTRQATIDGTVAKVESIVKCRGAVVVGAAPELAFDVDREGELAYARAHETA
jgi:hypothetical protein